MPADAPAAPELQTPSSGGFWYPVEESGAASAVEVLRAVRRFRAADLAMRTRARTDMDMNATDLLALRHLIAAGERSETIGPKDLSRYLGISSAATAKLLSRLEGAGRLRREPHPSDRRAQVLHATTSAHDEVRHTLAGAHQRMLAAAERLTASEQLAVVGFLDELSGAMPEPAAQPDPADQPADGTSDPAVPPSGE